MVAGCMRHVLNGQCAERASPGAVARIRATNWTMRSCRPRGNALTNAGRAFASAGTRSIINRTISRGFSRRSRACCSSSAKTAASCPRTLATATACSISAKASQSPSRKMGPGTTRAGPSQNEQMGLPSVGAASELRAHVSQYTGMYLAMGPFLSRGPSRSKYRIATTR